MHIDSLYQNGLMDWVTPCAYTTLLYSILLGWIISLHSLIRAALTHDFSFRYSPLTFPYIHSPAHFRGETKVWHAILRYWAEWIISTLPVLLCKYYHGKDIFMIAENHSFSSCISFYSTMKVLFACQSLCTLISSAWNVACFFSVLKLCLVWIFNRVHGSTFPSYCWFGANN